MKQCLWCDDPVDAGPLCGPCKAVNEYPPFHCHKHPIPTLGPSCGQCDDEAAREARRRERNAPVIAQLQAMRVGLVQDWHEPWPGINFCKALAGQSIDSVLTDLIHGVG